MLTGKDAGREPEIKLSPALKYLRCVSPVNREGGILPVSKFPERERVERWGMLSPQVLGMDPVKVLLSRERVVVLAGKVVGKGPVNKLLEVDNCCKWESRRNVDGRDPVNLFTCKEICSKAGIVVPQLSGIGPVKLLAPRSISTVKGEKVSGKVPVS